MYVLDTSACLTFIEDEDGADIVQSILESAGAGEAEVFVSFMSFMEVYYITRRERDALEAAERLRLMTALPVQRVDSSESQGILAAQLKAEHRLSVADCWIAALAIEYHAVLVHKDPEFAQIQPILQVLELPYKVSGRTD